uniref:NSF attachment protein alpha n=1 Tax=Equus asinus TaxID=9793 RepID=A0A9L0I7N9_EQUAS
MRRGRGSPIGDRESRGGAPGQAGGGGRGGGGARRATRPLVGRRASRGAGPQGACDGATSTQPAKLPRPLCAPRPPLSPPRAGVWRHLSPSAAAMDNSGKEAEAMALLAEAERKVKNSQSFFSGLFGGSSKVEEACEIYARAANMFKMAKNWSAAGNAFCQAAQLHLQLQSKHDAATCFVDAGNAFKKADPQEAINCLMRAIEIYTDMGRFTIAAKHHISIAEIYETELVDIEKVSGRQGLPGQQRPGLQQPVSGPGPLSASNWGSPLGLSTGKGHGALAALSEGGPASDPGCTTAARPLLPPCRRPSPTTSSLPTTTKARSPTGTGTQLPPATPALGPCPATDRPRLLSALCSSANKCLLKVAGYAAQLEQYQKAIDIYEQVGTTAMDSPLLKYSAKDYFFKAALCHFCIDMLNAKLAVQKYEELFPAFSDSRECKLMKKLLEAHEEQNVDGYTEAVKEYDSISRLDQWLTTMLLRVKKTIQGDEEDLR